MYYFTNLVYKEHDTFLKDLSGVCEIPDIAKAKDPNYLLTRNNGVDAAAALNILSDDLGAGFSKAQCEQCTGLHDSLFKDICFEYLIALFESEELQKHLPFCLLAL